MKKQLPVELIAVPILLIVALVGYFLLVKPKQDEAGRLAGEIAELDTKVQIARAAQQAPPPDAAPAIQVAEVFRLSKAMPDAENMPDIILQLTSVASAAGVEFVSIAPEGGEVRSTYTAIPINLTFEGNYYDLADFLFRLRNLVAVRDGQLLADGRLFALDSLSLSEGPDGFPEVTAALTLVAYAYTTETAAAPTPTPVAPPGETTAPEGEGEGEGTEPAPETP